MRRAFMVIGMNIVFIALYCVPGVAATVIVDGSNYVTEIRSLVVPSLGTFDVEFYNGSYAEIWGTGFDFSGKTAAEDAVNAVCGALNDDDNDPTLIYFEGIGGNSDLTVGAFHIPYEYYYETNPNIRWGQYEDPDWREIGDVHKGLNDPVPYAKFSQVPIPGAVWLLGSGLIGIVVFRRKFRIF